MDRTIRAPKDLVDAVVGVDVGSKQSLIPWFTRMVHLVVFPETGAGALPTTVVVRPRSIERFTVGGSTELTVHSDNIVHVLLLEMVWQNDAFAGTMLPRLRLDGLRSHPTLAHKWTTLTMDDRGA
jgi:hypothetical protein